MIGRVICSGSTVVANRQIVSRWPVTKAGGETVNAVVLTL